MLRAPPSNRESQRYEMCKKDGQSIAQLCRTSGGECSSGRGLEPRGGSLLYDEYDPFPPPPIIKRRAKTGLKESYFDQFTPKTDV
eukprot:4175702-Amphidinium_carterae.1